MAPGPRKRKTGAVTVAERETYVRLQATYIGRLGVEVGIFVAVHHLRRADILTIDEEDVYFDVDDWFEVALSHPSLYDDGNSIGAVTWFKRSTAAHMLQRLAPLQAILSKYAVDHAAVESQDPARSSTRTTSRLVSCPIDALDQRPCPTESSSRPQRRVPSAASARLLAVKG